MLNEILYKQVKITNILHILMKSLLKLKSIQFWIFRITECATSEYILLFIYKPIKFD